VGASHDATPHPDDGRTNHRSDNNSRNWTVIMMMMTTMISIVSRPAMASRLLRGPDVLPGRELTRPDGVACKVALVKAEQLGLRTHANLLPVARVHIRCRPLRDMGRRLLSV